VNYLEFFELSQEPFSNAPVARFYYDSQQHSQALVRLRYAVDGMKGLAVLVGDIGAGKTTLARRLLDSLPEEQFEAALLMVVHAETTASWLLSRIALLLGVENPADDKLRLLSQLYQRLVAIHESGKKAVVLIDEAQMLRSRELMEEFRGLLNLELTEKKLLTFVFFGLYELEENLHLDEPLNQRVAMRVRLEPLSRTSTAAYVAHRLKLAGAKRPLFTEAAIDAVHRFGRGTPRLLNTVCDNALLETFFLRQGQVDEAVVSRVAQDLGLSANALPAQDAVPVAPPAPATPAPGSVPAPVARAEAPKVATAPRVSPDAVTRPMPAARPAAPAAAVRTPAPTPVMPPPATLRPAAPAPAPRPAAVRPGFTAAATAAAPQTYSPSDVLDLGVEDVVDDESIEEAAAAFAKSEPTPPTPPPAAQAKEKTPLVTGNTTPEAALDAIDGMTSDEVEIPQIDALDDIDSILDQLEDKG
jgi:type II secretory pathway predicted ATPase ExeA